MDVLAIRPLPLAEWLSVVEREYLSAFVPAGGGAVKFAILADEAAIGVATAQLMTLGHVHSMLTVQVEARHTRVHMMQELFFAIVRTLPWNDLIQGYVEAVFSANAYPWPRPGETMTMSELASHFAVAPSLLARQRDQWLTAGLWHDRRLAQDFRAALLWLCVSQLEPDGSESAAPVLQWLHGDKVAAALLRRADISARISRTNARAMPVSLCQFLHEGELRYSPAAVMDTYEVLREIVDGVEDLPGLFVAVLADAELATGDPRRSLSQYAALQMRVWPDVRPGDRQNPVAPLVWLAS